MDAVIAQLNEPTVSHRGLYASVGIVIVFCGGGLVVVGYLQHKAVLDQLRGDDATPRPRWPLTITATAVAAALLLAVLIAVST